MKSVTQEHPLGCSVACVAYVLGITYKKALKLFDNPKHAELRGYYCGEIAKALKKGGKEYSFCRFGKSKSRFLKLTGCIVFVTSPRYSCGHFLSRTSMGTWMDPWIKFPVLAQAKSGFRIRLPGKPRWILYPVQSA
jgi:hypothetical protein